MIEREGARYGEAIDPLNSGMSYIETDIPIEMESITEVEKKAIAYDIFNGGDKMSILQEARAIRTIIETAAASLDDKTASTAPILFPRLKQDGSLIEAETRINHNGSTQEDGSCKNKETRK